MWPRAPLGLGGSGWHFSSQYSDGSSSDPAWWPWWGPPWQGPSGPGLAVSPFCQPEGKGENFWVFFIFNRCFSQRCIQLSSGLTDCQFPKPNTDWFPIRYRRKLLAASPKTSFLWCKTSTLPKSSLCWDTTLAAGRAVPQTGSACDVSHNRVSQLYKV